CLKLIVFCLGIIRHGAKVAGSRPPNCQDADEDAQNKITTQLAYNRWRRIFFRHGVFSCGLNYSSRVEISPSGKPWARALSTLRIILPERVLGSLSTKLTVSGR